MKDKTMLLDLQTKIKTAWDKSYLKTQSATTPTNRIALSQLTDILTTLNFVLDNDRFNDGDFIEQLDRIIARSISTDTRP